MRVRLDDKVSLTCEFFDLLDDVNDRQFIFW